MIKHLIAYLRAIATPDDGLALQRDRQRPGARHQGGHPPLDKIGDIIYERKISAWAGARALLDRRRGSSGVGTAQEGRRLRRDDAQAARGGAGLGPASLAEKVLEESGYRDALAGEATLEAEERIENLLELVAQMRTSTSARP